ncbi:hypothetical protein PCE1_000802 [Barthelona sp. PCE]
MRSVMKGALSIESPHAIKIPATPLIRPSFEDISTQLPQTRPVEPVAHSPMNHAATPMAKHHAVPMAVQIQTPQIHTPYQGVGTPMMAFSHMQHGTPTMYPVQSVALPSPSLHHQYSPYNIQFQAPQYQIPIYASPIGAKIQQPMHQHVVEPELKKQAVYQTVEEKHVDIKPENEKEIEETLKEASTMIKKKKKKKKKKGKPHYALPTSSSFLRFNNEPITDLLESTDKNMDRNEEYEEILKKTGSVLSATSQLFTHKPNIGKKRKNVRPPAVGSPFHKSLSKGKFPSATDIQMNEIKTKEYKLNSSPSFHQLSHLNHSNASMGNMYWAGSLRSTTVKSVPKAKKKLYRPVHTPLKSSNSQLVLKK